MSSGGDSGGGGEVRGRRRGEYVEVGGTGSRGGEGGGTRSRRGEQNEVG